MTIDGKSLYYPYNFYIMNFFKFPGWCLAGSDEIEIVWFVIQYNYGVIAIVIAFGLNSVIVKKHNIKNNYKKRQEAATLLDSNITICIINFFGNDALVWGEKNPSCHQDHLRIAQQLLVHSMIQIYS